MHANLFYDDYFEGILSLSPFLFASYENLVLPARRTYLNLPLTVFSHESLLFPLDLKESFGDTIFCSFLNEFFCQTHSLDGYQGLCVTVVETSPTVP